MTSHMSTTNYDSFANKNEFIKYVGLENSIYISLSQDIVRKIYTSYMGTFLAFSNACM